MRKKSSKYPKWTIAFACLAIVGTVVCGYGHAAISTNLLISGEATVGYGGANFTSTYMQDVTPEECRKVDNDMTKQLIDKRDGKKYWVAKFRDGGCWMVQDLKFDLVADADGNVELTSELTDINPSEDNWTLYEEEVKNGQTILKWNQNSYYPPSPTERRGNIGSSSRTTYSIHLNNERIIKNPLVSRSGDMFVNGYDDNDQEIWVYKPGQGFENGVSYDNETMTFDERYLIGNYYQYNTATAGSRASKEEAVSSICPRGWGLPRWGDSGDPDPLAMFPIDTMNYYTSDNGKTSAWPFYFSIGAYYFNSGVDVNTVSQNSYYWTSWSSGASGGAINAGIPDYTVHYGQPIYWGIPVRCGLRMAE